MSACREGLVRFFISIRYVDLSQISNNALIFIYESRPKQDDLDGTADQQLALARVLSSV
jgi:hypothetical protein